MIAEIEDLYWMERRLLLFSILYTGVLYRVAVISRRVLCRFRMKLSLVTDIDIIVYSQLVFTFFCSRENITTIPFKISTQNKLVGLEHRPFSHHQISPINKIYLR